METIIRLKGHEFTANLINTLKKFLASNNDSEIVISISKPVNKKSQKKETSAQMKTRINRVIEEVENKKNLISFTAKEFETLASALSGK